MKRFSKKRQSIIDCLRQTTEHPSAEWIYNRLKSLYPDLSLATVYRNLKELQDEGVITSVGIVCDKERFDGNVKAHSHAVCSKCGKVMDIHGIEVSPDLILTAEKLTNFRIDYSKFQFVGLCEDCKNQEKQEGKQ